MQLFINKYEDGNIKNIEITDIPRNKFRGDWTNEFTKFPQPSVFPITVVLNGEEDRDIINALEKEGYTFGVKPSTDGDATIYYLNTKISYVNYNQKGYNEPIVKQIIGDRGISLHENTISNLRNADIESCNMELNVWRNQNDELKLYCNKLFVDCKVSRLDDMYGDVEFVD